MLNEYIKNPYYNLTTLLNGFYNYYHSDKRNINHYINLENLIQSYKQRLNYYSQEQEQRKITNSIYYSNSRIFKKTITFENNNFYKIYWNIDSIKQYINKTFAQAYNVRISDVISDVEKQDISSEKLLQAYKNEIPIFIALYPPLNDSPLIIDGNHRVLSRHLKGLKTIKAYILEPEIHLLFTTHKIFQLLYTIHHNLTVIFQYVNGVGDESFVNNIINLDFLK